MYVLYVEYKFDCFQKEQFNNIMTQFVEKT